MNYRGIIIKESLEFSTFLDKESLEFSTFLDNVKVLSTKLVDEGTSDEWHMFKVQIPETQIHEFVKEVANSLKGYEPWYAHFYHEDPMRNNLIVVFYHKYFNRGKRNEDLVDVVEYGLKEGIPREQLDFRPRNVSEEVW